MTTAPDCRFPLGQWPTPLHRLERLEKALGIGPLFVKRDDLTGFAMAGNKTRPLEYIIGAAVTRSCDLLVAGGSGDSNFCHAAAAAAATAGLDCELIVSMPDRRRRRPTANMNLAEAFGARLHTTTAAGRLLDDEIFRHAGERRRSGRRPLAVPRGGSTALGALGFTDAAGELSEQLNHVGLEPDAVVCAVGSGGTYAGLIAGALADGAPWRPIGASVSRPLEEITKRVLDLARQSAHRRATPPPTVQDINIVNALGAGHGQVTAGQAELVRLALVEEGLLLDGVYTVKAFELAVDLARNASRPIVFWHTGGVAAAIASMTKGGSDG